MNALIYIGITGVVALVVIIWRTWSVPIDKRVKNPTGAPGMLGSKKAAIPGKVEYKIRY